MSKKYKQEEEAVRCRLSYIIESNFSRTVEVFGHFELFLVDPLIPLGLLKRIVGTLENKTHKLYQQRIRILAVQAWIEFNSKNLELPARHFMDVSQQVLTSSQKTALENLLVSIVEGFNEIGYKHPFYE